SSFSSLLVLLSAIIALTLGFNSWKVIILIFIQKYLKLCSKYINLKKNILKKYLIEFKPFLVFIGVFFCTYIFFTFLYKVYLDSFQATEIDGITQIVSKNVGQLISVFNSDIQIFKSISDAWLEVWYQKKYVIRIVEGCNAVSVIIL